MTTTNKTISRGNAMKSIYALKTSVQDRIGVLENKNDRIQNDASLSSNTKKTQNYQITHELKLLTAVMSCLDYMSLSGIEEIPENLEKDVRAIIPQEVKKTIIEVHEGDNVIQLLDKYSSVKDIYKKLTKACDDAGLKIVGQDIVKA